MTASAPAPETTPEHWDRMRAFLRSLPSADTLSRTANSLDKEKVRPTHPPTHPPNPSQPPPPPPQTLVAAFLSQHLSLIQLFLALQQATQQQDRERLTLVANVINRCFW